MNIFIFSGRFSSPFEYSSSARRSATRIPPPSSCRVISPSASYTERFSKKKKRRRRKKKFRYIKRSKTRARIMYVNDEPLVFSETFVPVIRPALVFYAVQFDGRLILRSCFAPNALPRTMWGWKNTRIKMRTHTHTHTHTRTEWGWLCIHAIAVDSMTKIRETKRRVAECFLSYFNSPLDRVRLKNNLRDSSVRLSLRDEIGYRHARLCRKKITPKMEKNLRDRIVRERIFVPI